MNKENINVVFISYGKDSLACLYKMKELGIPVNVIAYVDIRYDSFTSAEIPEHLQWIRTYAQDRIYKDFPTSTYYELKPDYTFLEGFFRKRVKGKRVGTIYGFPTHFGRWCNYNLKIVPIRKLVKKLSISYNVIQYVGIAKDEGKRIDAQLKLGNKLPLVDLNMTEKDCREYCKSIGMLSPAYIDHKRLGCWFCPLSCRSDLNILKNKYPELYNKLIDLEPYSEVKFKWNKTLKEYMHEKV